MMDILYVLTYSNWNNNELKYSLRSLEKFGKNIGKIYICGYKPNFINYNSVIHVPFEEKKDCCRNTRDKIFHVCKNIDISENFVLFNDDFYLLEELDLNNIPKYSKGIIEHKSESYFEKMLLLTEYFLKENKKTNFDYEVHIPCEFNKSILLNDIYKIYEQWEKPKPEYSLSLRSLYFNWINAVPTIIRDNKIAKDYPSIDKVLNIKNFLSTCDNIQECKYLIKYLENNFFIKSKWEK